MSITAYDTLAPIYDRLGLSKDSEALMPRLYQRIQSRYGWVGRRVMELGSGTGGNAIWLAHRGLNTLALEQSGEMIMQARVRTDTLGLGLTWKQHDVRQMKAQFETTDLVLALNLFNDFANLRELEMIISSTYNLLEPGRLFVFDMMTIEGLTELGRHSGELYSDDRLLVYVTRSYDFDRQANTSKFVIFTHNEGLWHREDAVLVQRGYPVQAIIALLQRTGFVLSGLETSDFVPYDPTNSRGERVIFYAQRPASANGASK